MFDQWDKETQAKSGWSGVFSLPRELWLRSDLRLGMRPVEELKMLRYNQRGADAQNLAADSALALDKVRGNTVDMEVVIEPGAASSVGIKVCCAADGGEETAVGYDAENGSLFIDTTKSSRDGMGPKLREAGPFKLEPGEPLKLRVLVDKSIVEVFANDRQAVVRRIYPSDRRSVGTKLFSIGGASKLVSLRAWDMMPANDH